MSMSKLSACVIVLTTLVAISFFLDNPSFAKRGPDLSFTTVAIDPTAPSDGNKTTLLAVIVNQGDQTAWFFRVSAVLDGTPVHSETVTSLHPSASKAFSAQWTATSGQHELCWVADPDNDILEINETNNQKCISFVVTPKAYEVTVFIAGLPAIYSTSIYVDGANAGVIAGGESRSFSFAWGTAHRIHIDQYVSGAPQERFYAPSNLWTFQSSGSDTFQYQRQFYLTVSTNPVTVATVPGEGWYTEGQQVTLTPPAVEGYTFSYWTFDGANLQTQSLAVTMNSPHRVVANYAMLPPPPSPSVDVRLILVGAVILVPVVVWWVIKKERED